MTFDEFSEYIHEHDEYHTLEQRPRSKIPTLRCYTRFLMCMFGTGAYCRFIRFDRRRINRACFDLVRSCEANGGMVHITGLGHLRRLDVYPVIIGNHMSAMETVFLPGLLAPFMQTAYILKRSLLKYPILGKVFQQVGAITVTRTNAKKDLKDVLTQGKEILQQKAVVVFPQSSRSPVFVPEKFNTLGLRLAKHAGVPAVPLALKTDMLSNGKVFKEVGRVYIDRPVHLSFGAPIEVTNVKADHQRILDFIVGNLRDWGTEVREETAAGDAG